MKRAAFLGITMAAGCFIGAGSLSAAVCIDCTPDTIVDFTATGTFDDNATLSGVLDIDITNGSVMDGDLSIVGGDIGSSPEIFTDLQSGGVFEPNTTWGPITFLSSDDSYTLSLSLDLSAQNSTSSLIGYAGGNLCNATDNCNNEPGNVEYVSGYGPTAVQNDPNLTSGTLSPSPEPASFLLMAAPALWFGIKRAMNLKARNL